MEEKERILTGDRTTGRLHLGHYAGSLQNRVRLQHSYDTFVLLADVQALTTHFKSPGLIAQSILDVAIDNLSAGLDPEAVTLVQQSQVPAIAELTVLFSMLVSVNALRHNPTVKTEAAQYGYGDLTYGFLGYPVSQAADITFCRAALVPVGEDQLPHLELARKLVRRFNALYGRGRGVLPLPRPLLGIAPRLAGLDGSGKMGKSLGNAIYLSDSPQAVDEKVRRAVTDTGRVHVSDRGNPDSCPVGSYHKTFSPAEYGNIAEMCRGAAIECAACKGALSAKLCETLAPLREKRACYEARVPLVKEYIHSGTQRARVLGAETLAAVKDAMGLALLPGRYTRPGRRPAGYPAASPPPASALRALRPVTRDNPAKKGVTQLRLFSS